MKMKKIAGVCATAAAVAFAISPATSTLVKAAGQAVKCYGVNACKGKSACKTANNACKGKNACKGRGYKMRTEASCKKENGSTTEPAANSGSTTDGTQGQGNQ